ncbi:gamma-glutamyl:cysteine ligase YbdK (ATP-grasp superfamily) [Paeniglutamicibacter psychrophenolicus]|nr:gamma-glutamyl:cysteine ligase YbdK (ATP-grasp superfamily) [Paeniglutamicibacter psychrophenolicus]
MRSFGIEEEFFILEPLAGLPRVPIASARAELLALTAGGTRTHSEFLACQLEGIGPICTQGAEALESAQAYRTVLPGTGVIRRWPWEPHRASRALQPS